MSRLDLASLRVGDVLESHQTLQVTYVGKDYVETQDVQSGYRSGYTPQDVDGSRSSRKLTMVKRAVRKPKVGDVITGEELKAIRWKRGTVFQIAPGSPKAAVVGAVVMLDADGILHGSTSGATWPIEQARKDTKFKLLHVA